ncbi:solute carrier family 45 member 4-like [Salarias fasciatus]|uniref:Solute carrier family 45 member 4-like n=1 Tax=Salarias fasciatus TaxID=181472 RepID=A0A672FWG4_SALFA|nr:solute carrier family 45 member 4-like [Salarias fasciatus]XP_029959532.1 solute carrier family 45 member 4-like [Salarias fasciatus]
MSDQHKTGGEEEEKETSGLTGKTKSEEENEINETNEIEKKVEEEDGRAMQIPLHRWLMHGALMFGREFCYAMETALVTPVLLQIGLPEKYYSLTWFLSPVFGLIFTPLLGSASDRCTLSWGRRRPFILALCVGALIGVALFLNGSLIGLSVGDSVNNQPIGIILTIVGVVILDFCADAAEGPVRAYLLDVADTEEQDIALNIHAISASVGGAVGYMLGGLDWTGTALGIAFKAQEQVLFLFTSIVFIISVILHMFSIPEERLTPAELLNDTRHGGFSSKAFTNPESHGSTEDGAAQGPSGEQEMSALHKQHLDLLSVERVRSKSDSVLAMSDASVNFHRVLLPDLQTPSPESFFLPVTDQVLEDVFTPSVNSFGSSPSIEESSSADQNVAIKLLSPVSSNPAPATNGFHSLLQNKRGSEDQQLRKIIADKALSSGLSSPASPNPGRSHGLTKTRDRACSSLGVSRPRAQSFYRQPSFTFSYYGRVGSQRSRAVHPQRIAVSRSLNDLSKVHHTDGKELRPSAGSVPPDRSCSEGEADKGTTVRLLWLSLFKMPKQLWRLCVCHLLTWFAYMAESVFYTDFMGQVIYNGNPLAAANSTELQNYQRGVQMGCWGLVLCAATSAVSSAVLQKYLDNFDLNIKVVYVVGTLAFSVGAAIMAIFPNVYVTMVLIGTMGIMSMSMSYCPYALLGQYHEIKQYIDHSPANTKRGFGIDCAILTCQVYISQILVAVALGSIVEAIGSVRVVPVVASAGSFAGFLTACFLVIYPDIDPSSSAERLHLPELPDLEEHAGRTTDQKRPPLDHTERKVLEKADNQSLSEH